MLLHPVLKDSRWFVFVNELSSSLLNITWCSVPYCASPLYLSRIIDVNQGQAPVTYRQFHSVLSHMEPPSQPAGTINSEFLERHCPKGASPIDDDHDDKFGIPTLEELGEYKKKFLTFLERRNFIRSTVFQGSRACFIKGNIFSNAFLSAFKSHHLLTFFYFHAIFDSPIGIDERGCTIFLLNYSFWSYLLIIYYWTGLLILDQSYLVGNLTNSKIAETKAVSGVNELYWSFDILCDICPIQTVLKWSLKSWHFCISNFRTC